MGSALRRETVCALMPDPVDTLILDLLEWIGPKARPYREVIEAWCTSCPQLPVWEEANARGFVEHHHSPEHRHFGVVRPDFLVTNLTSI